MLGITLVKIAVALCGVVMAAVGVELRWCILTVAVAPAISVIAAELGIVTAHVDLEERR